MLNPVRKKVKMGENKIRKKVGKLQVEIAQIKYVEPTPRHEFY